MADSPLARIPDPVLQQYKKRFDAIDLNKDGIITIREMATVGKVLGYKLSTDELFSIFGRRDLDESGGITFDEFVVAMMERARMNKAAGPFREAFKLWDTRKTGYINSDDAFPILEKELGFDMAKTEGLLDIYDKDKDYKISLYEFMHFWPRVQELKAEIVKNFKEYDVNGDGYVEFEEIKKKMSPQGFSDADIRIFFDKYDLDKDGRLNYTEFAKFWDIPIY